jgi:DNA-binding CsgD family transcriptional regulator
MRAAYRRAWSAIALRERGGAAVLARRQLAAARAELKTLGALRYAALVDAAVAKARPRPHRRATGLLDANELRIALKIAQGYTNVRIADSLKLSPKRTATAVDEVRRKLGVTTRGQIASWVVQRGIERPRAPVVGR